MLERSERESRSSKFQVPSSKISKYLSKYNNSTQFGDSVESR